MKPLPIFILVAALFLTLAAAVAPGPKLELTAGGESRNFDSRALLARKDAVTLTVPLDVSYRRSMTYRAVPLRALLATLPSDTADTFEVRATDGFVAQIPRALIYGKPTPWVAIEDPGDRWPDLPGKTSSAGPFYLVWQDPTGAGTSPEQWPYAMVALRTVASPAQRWPGIAVDDALPAGASARRGQGFSPPTVSAVIAWAVPGRVRWGRTCFGRCRPPPI